MMMMMLMLMKDYYIYSQHISHGQPEQQKTISQYYVFSRFVYQEADVENSQIMSPMQSQHP